MRIFTIIINSSMKIKAINAVDIEPIKKLSISDMGNVVIIAGANGSGKTRLKEAIKNTFQNPNAPQIALTIESTRPEEEEKIGKTLDIVKGTPSTQLQQHMDSRVRGGSYTSTVIQIDSDRSVQPVKFQPLNLSTPDPDDVEMDYRYFLNPFPNRWQEIVNKIFQKSANRDYKIAQYVKEHSEDTKKTLKDAIKKFPDTFEPYQKLFARLLPDKTLESIDPKQQKEFHYKVNGNEQLLHFKTLSSGEQEVVKITFDLLWKRITHSVFLIDEPELHLHPTLTFRLIEMLKEMGGGTNQFIFFTHSADLISTYYSSGNVYFIDTDTKSENQAHRLSDLRENHPDLVELMSENLGLFAVGKKLVFVEGEDSSIDRLSYHSIAQKEHSDLSFISVGSVENIHLLESSTKQLKNSLFGINFYMIRDRDGLSEQQINDLESNSTLRCLKKRHLENYFLDSTILAKVAERFCLDDKWKTKKNIDDELKKVCDESLQEALDLLIKDFLKIKLNIPIPKPKAIQGKTTQQLSDDFVKGITQSIGHLNTELTKEKLDKEFKSIENKLKECMKTNEWKNVFPGKILFRKICTSLGADKDKVRQAYIQIALEDNSDVFKDIKEIFNQF